MSMQHNSTLNPKRAVCARLIWREPTAVCLLVALVVLLATSREAAATSEPSLGAKSTTSNQLDSVPEYLDGVGVDEHLGRQLPLALNFVDELGRPVTLAQFFDNTVPVIITLNYSNCPMLCSLELTGLTNGLTKTSLKLGQSYRVVTVSLDPRESPEVARKTQARYIKQFSGVNADKSWHFLTGTEPTIRALADAVGFRYRYDSAQNQYYHTAAIALASPRGQLVRYLYGIEFSPSNLKLGLLEAAQGKIGNAVDRLILFCSAYNPKERGYTLIAHRIVTVGGSIILAVLLAVLVTLWRREARRSRRHESRDATASLYERTNA